MRRILLASVVIVSGACATGYRTASGDITQRVYKTVDQQQLTVEVFSPRNRELKPAVLVVHGGGWKNRSGDMTMICAELARKGYVAFNITYRLGPAGRYPNAVDDVRDALAWVKAHASEYEVDPQQIAAWGYSAGAHLVLMAGLNPASGLRGIVAGGTPADLTAWPNSEMVGEFLGKKYGEDQNLWAEASPVNHVKSGSPPVFMYHGEGDTLVEIEQMFKMREALLAKGVAVETHKVEGLGHIMVYLFSRESLDRGTAFLSRNFIGLRAAH